MAIGKDIFELQKIIGYDFSDISYLERALTHSSFSYEKKNKGISLPSNERLEFLGDSVLELVISKYVFANFNDSAEGSLTKMRQYLVCEKTLSKIAERISLGDYINLGRGEELSGHRKRPKVLADALEALIAAIYLDSGADKILKVEKLILKLFAEEIDNSGSMSKGDFKTMLQVFVEKDGAAILEYITVSESGPEHNKMFFVEARINNNVVGKGAGKTRKDAEMAAAREALALFGVSI